MCMRWIFLEQEKNYRLKLSEILTAVLNCLHPTQRANDCWHKSREMDAALSRRLLYSSVERDRIFFVFDLSDCGGERENFHSSSFSMCADDKGEQKLPLYSYSS